MGELLAVPNVSEGRDPARLALIGAAFARHARVLHASEDPDHHRAVFTLAGAPGRLHRALAEGAVASAAAIDLAAHDGRHPRVGALDVAPLVYLDDAGRGPAIAEALLAADAIGAAGIPVFLYGELGEGRTRADLRRGGPAGLAARVAAGDLRPDYGPRKLDPGVGATLVAARPPLLAFNLALEPPAGIETARAIAAAIREGGADGLPGVRAIGLWLPTARIAQVSVNVEDHRAVALAAVLAAVERHHAVAGAELVAPAPEAAVAGWPGRVDLRMPPPLEALLSR